MASFAHFSRKSEQRTISLDAPLLTCHEFFTKQNSVTGILRVEIRRQRMCRYPSHRVDAPTDPRSQTYEVLKDSAESPMNTNR